MKSRITAGLTALAMLGSAMPMAAFPALTSITAQAADYTEETYGDLTIRKYPSYVEIAGCDKTVESVEIPAVIDGLPVISIASNAFSNFGACQFKSITLPESIVSIGRKAFYQCDKLEEIVLPDTVQELGTQAFEGCTSLKSVKLPKYLEIIGYYTFAYCSSLTSIEIPSTVTWIDDNAFEYSGLTSITIPENVTVDTFAFRDCEQLETVKCGKGVKLGTKTTVEYGSCFMNCKALTSVELLDGLTFIPHNCFLNCTSLKSVSIPDSVYEIGVGAFGNCSSLEEIKMPSSITEIQQYAFKECKSLKAFSIPGTVKTIDDEAFSYCTALNSLTIGEGVETISAQAFAYCSGLTEVTLPASVQLVGSKAFMDCAKLESVTILNPECQVSKIANTICNYTLNSSIIYTGTSYYNGTIYGYEGSGAQEYAEEYSYHFELIGSAPQSAGLGDINEDNIVNASDAAKILIAAAAAGAGGDYGLTEAQMAAADLNGDNIVNASDAALVLIYAAYVGAGGTDSLPDYLKTR